MSLQIPYVSLIFAMSTNGIIGKAGKMPWHSAADFKWFAERTAVSIIVMGRKTWESLDSKPLAGRMNVVVTRQKDYVAEGAIVASDLYDAVTKGRKEKPEAHVYVIGGKQLLEEACRIAADAYVTSIHCEVKIDDTCVKAPVIPLTNLINVFELNNGADGKHVAVVWHYKF